MKKNKEEDDAHVIRYEYDPRPDKLDNYEPKRKRGQDGGGTTDDPSLWWLENGRWHKRSRREGDVTGDAGQGYLASAEPPPNPTNARPPRTSPKRRMWQRGAEHGTD